MGNEVFFRADEPGHGYELWKTDGTPGGTTLVKEFVPPADRPGGPYGDYSQLTAIGQRLFFSAADNQHGGELWTSDGTASGTFLLKDINAGPASSYPHSFTDFNGTLFFTACDLVHGPELWKSDGTPAGTVLVKDTYPGAGKRPDSVYGVCLGNEPPYSLTPLGTLLLFSAETAGVDRRLLWRSDGTAEGTSLVKVTPPIHYVPTVGQPDLGFPRNLVSLNGKLLFTLGSDLWTSDGSSDGTLPSVELSMYLLAAGRSRIFTIAGSPFGLWTTDGTPAGTVLVKAEDNGMYTPTSPRFDNRVSDLQTLGDSLYFLAKTGEAGYELWKSDGTADGTRLVRDIRPGPDDSNVSGLTPAGGLLYFSADDGTNGRQLWRTDGTTAGTMRVTDIHPGLPGNGQWPERFMVSTNGLLFFPANDGLHGWQLWAYRLGSNPGPP
jgi:ELWxxDGT repeat protein